jgi:hypothetical protein
MITTLAPGWVDELAKSQVKTGEVKKINTDPPEWEGLRRYGKKPVRWNCAEKMESARRGGQKTRRLRAGVKKEKMFG